MGYDAQEFVRKLPREIKLTPTSRRLIDYLAWRANEKDALKCGVYSTYPAESAILDDLKIGRGTLYRSFNQLEFECGFYLITRRDSKDRRAVLFDLHIRPEDLKPDAVLERKQLADARLSAARGKIGFRKRITSQIGTCLPEITSQNGTEHVPKRDVITSQNGTETPEITSQNGTQNKEYKRTRNSEQGIEQGGERPPADKPKTKNAIRTPAALAVTDQHAAMWTACIHFIQGYPLPDKFEASDVRLLLNDAVTHVGGWTTFKGFKQNPRNASFAQEKFLDYLRRHDPAYEVAVGKTIRDSLDEPPRKRHTVRG